MVNAQQLKNGLQPLFADATMPKDVKAAAKIWLNAYKQYALSAVAGPVLPSFTAQTDQLVANFGPADFRMSLDISLATLWTTTLWAGPGFTGIAAPTVSIFSLLSAAQLQFLSIKDQPKALSLLSQQLHTYTLGVVVTVTNITTGVIAPFNVL